MSYLVIPLTQGLPAIIDAENFKWLNRWKWYAHRTRYTWYAYTDIYRPNRPSIRLIMHRLILGLDKGDGREVDHINGRGWDNRIENLRIVTHCENLWNIYGRRGYYFQKQTKKFRAMISVNNKTRHIGLYNTPQEAREAYLEAKAKYHRIGGVSSVE